MVLFSASSAPVKSTPSQVQQDEVAAMKKELSRMRDAARLRARHGPQLTDGEVDDLLAAEADMVVRKAKAKEAEELNRQNEIALDKKYRELACEMVKTGKMLISVDGKRVKSITPDLLILCPHCAKPLGEIQGAAY